MRRVAGQTYRQGEGGYPPGNGRGPHWGGGYGGGGRARGPQRPHQAPEGEPGYPEYYAPGPSGPGAGGSPGHDDAPGHTPAFTMGEPLPTADGGQAYEGGGAAYDGGSPYDGASPYGGGPYDGGQDYGEQDYDNVATYRAGQTAAPPVGPRLPWKQLISGIVKHPGRTFWQMRDHTMWGPALGVTFGYGLLAVFGFDAARSDVLRSTLATSIPWVLTTGVAVVLCGITLGAVTNTLARQLGGDGAWAPTIGLAMLITSLTDAPRLLFAMFLGGGNGFVQLLGWLTWLVCAALLTRMVATSHDLPRLKALGAASIQLVALLMLFKLPLL